MYMHAITQEYNKQLKQDKSLAIAGTTARCALYNECTNPNPPTNLIPVHNLVRVCQS